MKKPFSLNKQIDFICFKTQPSNHSTSSHEIKAFFLIPPKITVSLGISCNVKTPIPALFI